VPWLDEVDVVTIGTSPFSHYELIRSALSRGKHVLTEKPFTLTVPEGEELVALAKEKGLCVGVVHNFQFARSFRKMLKDISSGRLGPIKSVIASQLGNPRRRLPAWYEDLPLGLFYDESPHFFYLLRRVAPGLMNRVSCTVFPSTTGGITPANIHVQYSSQASGQRPIAVELSMHFESPVSEWHLAVLGEQFLVDVDLFRDIYIRLPNDGLHTTWSVFRTSLCASWHHWTQHAVSGLGHLRGKLRYGNDEVFARFAEAVRQGTTPRGISGEDALAVLRMQHDVIAHHELLPEDRPHARQ
jgi:predicted dehydrogenase